MAITTALQSDLGLALTPEGFGAVGNGIADDTAALNAVLATGKNLVLSFGKTYRITSALEITSAREISGYGAGSVLAPDEGVDGIIVKGRQNRLTNFTILGGAKAIILRGESGVCTFNLLSDLTLEGNNTGLYLDGYADTAKPCYWNSFRSILVWKPKQHGVWLTKTGAGDTPNSNRFWDLNVYSNGVAPSAAATYSGIFVEYGRFQNSFTDSHVGLHQDFNACVTVGAGLGGVKTATWTSFVNLYTETPAVIANVRLQDDSEDTSITNLLPMSAGAAVHDLSGGSYWRWPIP